MANEFCIKQKFYISYHKGMLINIQSCFLQGCIVVFISSSFQLTFSLRFKLGLNMSIKHKAMKFFLKSRIKYTFDSNLHLVYIIVLQCTHTLLLTSPLIRLRSVGWMHAQCYYVRVLQKFQKKSTKHATSLSILPSRGSLYTLQKTPKTRNPSISKDNQSNQ